MTSTSFLTKRHSIAFFFLAAVTTALIFSSCKKDDPPHNSEAAAYSSDVLDKWITLQLRLMRNSTGIPNQTFSRQYAYTGIAALESIAPGLSPFAGQYRKWNGLAGLPATNLFNRYYYPANVNAAMAAMNRSLFPNANAVDKAAIDSLETALNNAFLTTQPQSRITKSAEFGKAVAAAVYAWSETDGYKDASAPYTPPVGPGLWVSTGAPASTPYWGNNRPVIAGSLNNTDPGAPVPYSTDTASAFYKMVKHVYDVRQNLTAEQNATALFWRDVPGVTSPGHWLSIQQQVMNKKNARLDKAALAYALGGAALNDALIACWKAKFKYNLVRPITYIKDVMGHTSWAPAVGTPPHPEYPSAHSSLSAAAAVALEKVFGNLGSFTDHTYDYMGFAPRTYTSFIGIAEDASISRVYGGIHYKPTVEAGVELGKKVASNIFDKYGHQGK